MFQIWKHHPNEYIIYDTARMSEKKNVMQPYTFPKIFIQNHSWESEFSTFLPFFMVLKNNMRVT